MRVITTGEVHWMNIGVTRSQAEQDQRRRHGE